MKSPLFLAGTLLLALSAISDCFASGGFDGSTELETRLFIDDSPRGDANSQTSLRLEAEWFTEWNGGDDQLVFKPFARIDNRDDEREHADIRELLWTHFFDDYEFSAGIGKVFWGVTESQHLVDIINQDDGVENIDGEDKLGQPMLQLRYFANLGTFEAYLLPYFRPRTFAGEGSRLRSGLLVDPDNEIYQSDNEEKNMDYALRWSHTMDIWGVGLSYFNGTSREPDLLQFVDLERAVSTPYYAQIEQLGADIQITTDAWLFKLEAIDRRYRSSDTFTQPEDFRAVTVGTEYTFVGVFDSIYDIGALAEYSYDDRDQQATSLLQNDVFLGGRFSFNDISSSEILFGVINDLDQSDHRAWFVEANTRIMNDLTANIELRYFDADDPADPLSQFKNDSFIQIGIEAFFD